MMKAVIITRPGGAEVLEVQERPAPDPGVGEIRVRVTASALNRADILQRKETTPFPRAHLLTRMKTPSKVRLS
jgi:NADPH:quinone reductase-like Zn-dependent oxidoreductase